MSGERVPSARAYRNPGAHRAAEPQDQVAVPVGDASAGAARRGSVSAGASSRLAEHLVPRSRSTAVGTALPAPRASLPVPRPPTPAQQQQIEKRAKKQAAIAAGQTVDDAMAYFEGFDALCARGLITAENEQRTLSTAFRWAERGIAAFGSLTELQRNGDDGQKSFVTLYQKRAAIATALARSLPPLPAEEAYALSARMLKARSEPVDLPALDSDLHAYLGQVDLAAKAIEPYIRASSEVMEKLGNTAHLKAYAGLIEVLKSAVLTLTKLRMRAFDLHKEQICTLGNRMVVAEGMRGTEILRETVAMLTCAVNLSDSVAIDLLQDARIPRQQTLASRMENGALLLREHAEAFIGLASRHFDAEAGAAQPDILEFARQLAVAIGALAQQCDAVLEAPKLSRANAKLLEGTTLLGQPTGHDVPALSLDDVEDSLVPQAPEASASAPSPRRSSAGKARKTAGRQAAQDAGSVPSAPALSLRQAAVLELAQERLKAFPAPKLARLRGPGDLLTLGESLQKDISVISAAMEQRSEPLSAARQMRRTLDGWFGAPGQWRARREQLEAAGIVGTPSVAQALVALDERIAAIDGLHRSVDAIGADRVKTFPYPDLKHVSHLLATATDAKASGPGVRVGAPRKLPSPGDPDDRQGTLFEVKLDTGKLADGRPAPSLYVHLHAKVPITAEACRTVPFEALDAFHVKTADQRGKGATWELLNDALHSVHRGVLYAEVLKALQHRMARG
ncbi:hypothetical protein [Paracidovorax valerianellae]|uniref:hypothetical protein n=1 Tax=Paracidovorax valerianellae TaxID=187868 RepID=UPI00230409B0|nr:hypothetical protein [Paracidovorax valerianellae]MDA8445716.1 hypothetical protein [Paracidovorax valerianellae]